MNSKSLHPYRSVTFILSAAYADPELQAEFGAKIPSCMVPLGTRRLLEIQVEEAFQDQTMEHVFVAVPHDYQPSATPSNTSVFPVQTESMDDTFRALFTSFVHWAANARNAVFEQNIWRVHVLNGDTLVTGECNLATDYAVYSHEETNFHWMRQSDQPDMVYVGKMMFVCDLSDEERTYEFAPLLKNAAIHRTSNPPQGLQWYDFGHVHTYYRSKRSKMVSRAFNQVEVTPTGEIYKRGGVKKIGAEHRWFEMVQHNFQDVRVYLPQVGELRNASYTLEYMACPTLAELYVFGGHEPAFWENIGRQLHRLTSKLHENKCPDGQVPDGLFLDKSEYRVMHLNASLRRDALDIIQYLREGLSKEPSTLIHGDLCFSNILYDQRADKLKVIDPRGLDSNNQMSIWGSPLYDFAKLLHSAIGMYDFRLADRWPSIQTLNSSRSLEKIILASAAIRNYSEKEAIGATALLFYSMLPLHSEDPARCTRLVESASLLYERFKNTK